VHCLNDVCPHRGAPLSQGWVSEVQGHDCVVCPYHGWAFDEEGVLRDVPAAEKAEAWPRKQLVDSYAVQEKVCHDSFCNAVDSSVRCCFASTNVPHVSFMPGKPAIVCVRCPLPSGTKSLMGCIACYFCGVCQLTKQALQLGITSCRGALCGCFMAARISLLMSGRQFHTCLSLMTPPGSRSMVCKLRIALLHCGELQLGSRMSARFEFCMSVFLHNPIGTAALPKSAS